MRTYRFSFGDAAAGPCGLFAEVAAGSPAEARNRVAQAMLQLRQKTYETPILKGNDDIVSMFFFVGVGMNKVTFILYFTPANLREGYIEGSADPIDYDGDVPRFLCAEHFGNYEVVDTYTGRRAPLGDGFAAITGPEGDYLTPGVPGFVDNWTEELNQWNSELDTLDAYFPDTADAEREACEADEPIRVVFTKDGKPYTFERRLGGAYVQLDGELKYPSYTSLREAQNELRRSAGRN